MVSEVRTILLNEEEVVTALTSYRRLNPGFLPSGKITGCKARDEVEAIVVIAMQFGGIVKPMERTLSAEALLEPIIHFCIENNILLPRRGRKSVIFDDGRPALYVEMDS